MGEGSATLRLIIDASHWTALKGAAEEAYPEECCGLVLGRRLPPEPETADGPVRLLVTRLVPAANLHPEPRRSFELDPAMHIATLRHLREAATAGEEEGGAETVIGHYHSHPDAPSMPSDRDRSQINDPDLVWLIASVEKGHAVAVTAWLPCPQSPAGFVPVERQGFEGMDGAAKNP